MRPSQRLEIPAIENASRALSRNRSGSPSLLLPDTRLLESLERQELICTQYGQRQLVNSLLAIGNVFVDRRMISDRDLSLLTYPAAASGLVLRVNDLMRVCALRDQHQITVFARNPDLRKEMGIPYHVEH